MVVIGLLGGIASGKSFAARHLESLGAHRLDADRTGHLVLREEEVKRALVARWGAQVLAADGEIDRSQVASIVFAPEPTGPAELAFLEQITHPRIGAELQRQIDELRRGDTPAVVLDAPVMLKADWDRLCDHILFLDASRNVRLARAAERGWTEAEFDAREAAQTDLAEKRRRSHIVIPSGCEPNQTTHHLNRFWRDHVAPPTNR